MKIRRYNRAAKNLSFYEHNFGFHRPFQVLIDGTFCFAALQNRVQIREMVPKYLGGEIKFLTTPCAIIETDQLGPKVSGAMQIIKSFAIHHCGHAKSPVTGSQCLLSMVGKKNVNRYIIATQDMDLRRELQSKPAVPVIHINRTSVVLDKRSEATENYAKKRKEQSVGLTKYEESVLTELKKSLPDLPQKDETDEVCGLKKPKRPNPLSCKKKQKRKLNDDDSPSLGKSSQSEEGKRRKRKRIKLAKHVKEELFSKSANTSTNAI